MSYRRGTCLGFILLLMVCHHPSRGKPLSSLQSLSRLLEDNLERPYASEEADQQLVPTDSLDQLEPELPWGRNRAEQGDGARVNEMTLQQLLSSVGSSRGYRQRSKKGYSRGCFGVKLDRIGAFSGLGC